MRRREWKSCWESCSRKYLQINMMKRSMSQNKAKAEAKAETTKRYRFRERMLSQISRIWAFRVFINRRVLIDCRYSKYDVLTTDRQTDKNLWRKRIELTAWQTHIDCCFSALHVICFRIAVCNKFIFVDVDCESVKNRTHAFWSRFSRLIKNFIEANSLVVVANSLNVVEADRH